MNVTLGLKVLGVLELFNHFIHVQRHDEVKWTADKQSSHVINFVGLCSRFVTRAIHDD